MSVLGFDVGTRYRYSMLGFEQNTLFSNILMVPVGTPKSTKKMVHFPILVDTGTFNFNIVRIKVLQLMFMLVRNNSKYYTCTKVQDVLQKHNL